MDDIDRDIQTGKIGKKDEPLDGWDYIRPKPPVRDLPPMKAIKKTDKSIYSKKPANHSGLFLLGFLCLIVIVFYTKYIGLW
jgi:hypothetical protein